MFEIRDQGGAVVDRQGALADALLLSCKLAKVASAADTVAVSMPGPDGVTVKAGKFRFDVVRVRTATELARAEADERRARREAERAEREREAAERRAEKSAARQARESSKAAEPTRPVGIPTRGKPPTDGWWKTREVLPYPAPPREVPHFHVKKGMVENDKWRRGAVDGESCLVFRDAAGAVLGYFNTTQKDRMDNALGGGGSPEFYLRLAMKEGKVPDGAATATYAKVGGPPRSDDWSAPAWSIKQLA